MRSPCFLSLLSLSVCLTFGSAASAQTSDPPPDLDAGLKPYGSFHGGDIDSVNLFNGGLSIHVPLLSYPQRGKLKLDLGIYYSNYAFGYVAHCTKDGTCTDRLLLSDVRNTYIDDAQSLTFDSSRNCNVLVPPATHLLVPDTTVRTSDGANHPIGDTGTGFSVTVDGTGLRSTAAGWADQDGITYGNGFKEDPNGNKITLNSTTSSWVDSLNRTIPYPPNNSYPNTFGITPPLSNPGIATDTSQCIGPLTATRAALWNVPGPSGTTIALKFCFANVTVKWSVYAPDNGTYLTYNQSWEFIQSIRLPNGQSWEFEYNDSNGLSPTDPNYVNYASLTKITFPTGGSISYTWGTGSVGTTSVHRAVVTRTLDAADGAGLHTWSYTYRNSGSPFTNTVTDPLGNYTDHVFSNLGVSLSKSAYEIQTNFYDKSSGTPILLKTLNTDYQWVVPTQDTFSCRGLALQDVLPIRVTTVWPGGQTSKVEYDYDSGFTYKDMNPSHTTLNQGTYGKVLAHRGYDYGSGAPGTLLRQTKIAYLSLAGPNASSYLANNLLSLPYTVQVLDGSGTQKAFTQNNYDETSRVSSGLTSSQQFDSAPPTGNYRGNNTSTYRWLNSGSLTCQSGSSGGAGSNVISRSTYFDDGMLNTSSDPCANTTTYAYSLTYLAAFPTTVTNALNQSTNHAYDLNTGLITSTTDPNNLTTSFSYDNMWRLSQMNHPDGAIDTITHQETTFPFTATLNKQINPSQTETTTNVFDGLGRVTQHQLNSDPQGPVYTDTTFDALGRVATVSNPHRTCGTDVTSSCGTTTYGYDALARKLTDTYPDNSILTTAYCGPSTLVTDPTNRWRRSRIDGLGRLVEVDEPNAVGATVASTGCPGTGEPIWVTTYSYDTLGNLTSVLQNGSHSRSFSFDSLSRLLSSTNPEVGTITYAYWPDGPVHTKTDARSITTTYLYDALHRETSGSYSNSDPTVTTAYDQSNCLGLSACQNIGHRTSMTDASGSDSWAYQVDKIDFPNTPNIHKEQRTTNGVTKPSMYYVDFVGNVVKITYPTGRTVNYSYDNANRRSTVIDGSNGITYATGFQTPPANTACVATAVCYTPEGTYYALSVGQTSSFTGLNLTHIYNNRLQPQEFKASSTGGSAIDISYSFADPGNNNKNAGHVFTLTNNLDSTRSQTFTYDQVNRITSARTTSTHATSPAHCWAETYQFDGVANGAWGNLTQIAASTNPNYTGCSQESGFTANADGNNHLSIFSYDLSGNTSSDGIVINYQWNGESQLKSAAGVTYTYDGDGRRVSKVGSKLYWYGSGDDILAETDVSGNTTAEYIFFGGKRIAMIPAGSNPTYYVEDLLGTSRVLTTNTGVVCYDADFYPYGGERAYTNTCPQNYKFEGKERDTETGNDDFGARYYSNRFGRWLSADWSAVPVAVPYADLTNPQTLNLYSMVADDPESFADLDGHDDGKGNSKPIPAAKCNFGCWLKFIFFGDPNKTRPAPHSNDPIGPVLVNSLIGLYNFGNRVFGNPQQDAYYAPTNKEQAKEMQQVELALLFIPELGEEEFASELHHIATNKGTTFAKVFRDIFAKAGMDLENEENLVSLIGHRGRHTIRYHEYVLARLRTALSGKRGSEYTQALISVLGELREELLANPRLPYQ